MDYKISEIEEKTWAVEDDGVRFFLADGDERALLIDSGMTKMDLPAIIKKLTDHPVTLVNTHADVDHISSNDAFESFYMHPSDFFLYPRRDGNAPRMLPVFEKDVFDLGNRTLEVIHLPGHTPGSITFLDRKKRLLIGGDPIQTGGAIYMFGRHRDMDAYICSLKRLMKRADEFDFIIPSHADPRIRREVIPALAEGAEDILAGKVKGYDEEVGGTPVTTYDTGITRFYCDRNE